MTQPNDRYERAHLVASVIAAARDSYGQGAAPFDYAIAGGDNWAETCLGNGVYLIANPDHRRYLAGEDIPGGYDSATSEARAARLRDEIAADLDAYRAKCRSRKYTGWSVWSSGPIRYADSK